MRTKTFSLLLTYCLHLTTYNIVWTIPLNDSDSAIVEMPLATNNLKAPLVADLDVSSLNKQLKHYIDTAISATFNSKVKEIVKHSQDELKATMLTYKERLQESKTVYEEDLAHLVGGFKSRFESLFGDLRENVTNLTDNLEEWKNGYTQTISEFGRFDLAVNKKCGQSSTFLDACNHAIDGNLVTFSHTGHTGFSDGVNYGTSKPYWWVDLGNTYKVRRVDVYNRLTSGHRLHNLDVTAGKSLSVMSLCDHYKGRAKNGELIILVCRQPIEARYVKLQIMEENTADNYLQLAAVEVYE
ncbi:unnamed protein product [Mytilus coruscus]|uniref:Fucolectin tachylectin-4 pentraxin-1 domain-containing protein n=1 Tax=Mytilus coruscus TaxID=42192 RepID=A0A6J8CBU5_MYTCO|nr:unnamed protein product [Mytilus coruscus]